MSKKSVFKLGIGDILLYIFLVGLAVICFLPFYRVLSYKRFGFGVTGYVVYGE